MTHTCHARGCGTKIPRKMLMCHRHWFKVPKEIRDRVWKHYRPGQEVGVRRIEPEWREAAADAVASLKAEF